MEIKKTPDKKSFKVMVLELAKDIPEFSADRQQTTPNFPISSAFGSPEWLAYENVSQQYDKKTLAEFHRRFDARIAEVLPGLKAKEAKYMTPNGLNTRGINMCGVANNPGAIRMCGTELSVLGAALP